MAALSELYLVKQHLLNFFEGHEYEELVFDQGPMLEVAPWFRVLRFRPGPRYELWAYVTLGACTLRDDGADLEFAVFSEYESPRFIELLTVSAYYHRDFKLGLEHTVPLGEPWTTGSTCNHYMVSLPYPLGPEFEVCDLKEGHAHIFWLLPITDQERTYKVKNGAEALESMFDKAELKYWGFGRQSVV